MKPPPQHYCEACERKGLCAGPARKMAFARCFIFSRSYWLLSPSGASESQQEREGHLEGFNADCNGRLVCGFAEGWAGGRSTWDQHEPEARARAEGRWRGVPPTPGEGLARMQPGHAGADSVLGS